MGEVFSPSSVTRNCSLQFLCFINNEKYKIRHFQVKQDVYVLVRFEPFDEKLMVHLFLLPRSFEGHLRSFEGHLS